MSQDRTILPADRAARPGSRRLIHSALAGLEAANRRLDQVRQDRGGGLGRLPGRERVGRGRAGGARPVPRDVPERAAHVPAAPGHTPVRALLTGEPGAALPGVRAPRPPHRRTA